MRINTNVMSMISYNAVSRINAGLAKSAERLASGLRINTAADDAAGLAITEKMTAQIKGLDQASRNAQDGISLLATAEGALNEIHSIMQRMRELCVQAANDTLTAEDRGFIKLEITELTAQVNAIATQTQFNKKKILNGDSAILWSASTLDIGVLVSGTLLMKDIFGQMKSAEGNYKITFDNIKEGQEQVQKSNIMYLKHGTHDTGTFMDSLSGLSGMSSLNMVEGVWRVTTRTSPFGGVSYFQGSASSTSGVVGAYLDPASTTQMAPGTYDIRLAENVPLMADFAAALTAGVVADVNKSWIDGVQAYDEDFNAFFDIDATQANISWTKVYEDDDNAYGNT
ncbi:MAG: flagellin, partial [Synergistaceae bacterium]|nr:flagellin [Synergistaceae bacterium]